MTFFSFIVPSWYSSAVSKTCCPECQKGYHQMIRLNLKTRNQRFGSIVVHTLPFTILTTVFQVQFLLRGSKSFLSQGFLRLQCISSFFFRNCQILYICSENRAKGISGFSSMPSWKTIIPSKCLPFHKRKLPDSIVFFETRQLF